VGEGVNVSLGAGVWLGVEVSLAVGVNEAVGRREVVAVGERLAEGSGLGAVGGFGEGLKAGEAACGVFVSEAGRLPGAAQPLSKTNKIPPQQRSLNMTHLPILFCNCSPAQRTAGFVCRLQPERSSPPEGGGTAYHRLQPVGSHRLKAAVQRTTGFSL